jgi:hypothetical protein
MLTLACIALFAQVKIGKLWDTWPIPLGLALSAVLAQLITLAGAPGIRLAGLAVAAIDIVIAGVLLARKADTPLRYWVKAASSEARQTFQYLRAGGISDNAILFFVAATVLALAAFSFLYVPIPLDEYNAIHAELIRKHADLGFSPVLAWPIMGLGFLHEYVLADITLTPWIGGFLVKLVPAAAWAVYALAVLGFARRVDPSRIIPWFWMAIAGLPMIIWSAAALYKNDLTVAALSFPALFMLAHRREALDSERLVQAGFCTGLAVAAKLDACVIAFTLMLFLPWNTPLRFFQSRLVTGLAILAGAACGGLIFVLLSNRAHFGHVLGFMTSTHLLTGGLLDRFLGFLLFAQSLFDPRHLVLDAFRRPQIAGAVLSFSRLDISLLFAISVVVYTYSIVRHRVSAHVALICLVAILITSAADRDLYMAHRYIIAPAILLMLEAGRLVVRATVLRPRPQWLFASLTIAGMFVLAQSGASFVTLFNKVELLRDPQAGYARFIARLAEIGGLSGMREGPAQAKFKYLREINEAARRAHSVANAAREYYFALEGVNYRQVLAWRRSAGEAPALDWSIDGLDRDDLIIVDEALYPPPREVRELLRNRCRPIEPPPNFELSDLPSLRAYRCGKS